MALLRSTCTKCTETSSFPKNWFELVVGILFCVLFSFSLEIINLIKSKFSRQNCGRFLIEAKCYSMQMRMLNIIFSYLCGREHMTKNPLAFTAMFERVITVTNGLSTAVTDIFNKNAELTLIEKHRLLDLLNHCAPKRSIYSIAITQEVYGFESYF